MREKTMTNQIICVGLALVLGGCAAAETAGQITFGETDWTGDGQTVLPKLATVLPWPNIDDLLEGQIDPSQVGSIPGVPTEFAYGTFAHLQGALRLSGECKLDVPFDTETLGGEESPFKGASFQILSCMADPVTGDAMPGCAQECQGFLGLRFETRLDVQILDQAQATAVVDLAEEQGITVTPEAIVQMRMRFYELSVYQGDYENGMIDVSCSVDSDCATAFQCLADTCTCRADIETTCDGDLKQQMLNPEINLMEKLSGFEFALSRTAAARDQVDNEVLENLEFCNFACNEEQECDVTAVPPICIPAKDLEAEVIVVDSDSVTTISPYTPQRYDLASDSDIINEIKTNITQKKAASVSLIQRLHIGQEHLYDVTFQGGGLAVEVQPEVVISGLEVATSSFL
jgi:hypothetical protein